MNKVALVAITAVISGAAGFAAGWFIKQKKDEELLWEMDEYVTNTVAAYEQTNQSLEAALKSQRKVNAAHAINKYKGVEVNPVEKEVKEEQRPVQEERPIPPKVVINESDIQKQEPDNMGPRLIPIEEWNDEMEQEPDWDKLEYTYFPKADLLCDEEAMIRIMDYTYEIGSEALGILRNLDENKQDDAVLYVRNPYLGCDIQITVDWEEPNAEWFDYEDIANMEGGVKG